MPLSQPKSSYFLTLDRQSNFQDNDELCVVDPGPNG